MAKTGYSFEALVNVVELLSKNALGGGVTHLNLNDAKADDNTHLSFIRAGEESEVLYEKTTSDDYDFEDVAGNRFVRLSPDSPDAE